jgi:F-type H+-transporting ATPase subunit a
MEFEFFQKAIKGSLVLTLILFLAIYIGLDQQSSAYAVLLGGLWSCLNVFLIKIVLQNILTVEKAKSPLKILGSLIIKFPLLYVAGYFMITFFDLPALYFLLGFSLIFMVLLVNSIKETFLPSAACFIPLLLLILPGVLQANLTTDVPEVPNIFTLLFHGDELTASQTFIHEWENFIFSVLAAVFVAVIFCIGAKRNSIVPVGIQNALEYFVEILQSFVLELLGPKGEKFVPFLGTLFIYILVMNWMVLIPLLKAPSSSLNITLALALCVFAIVQYQSIKTFGLKGYLFHMAGSPSGGVGWAMVPLMLPIELLTQMTRPLTLAFRLFGNVVGEDILIGAFALFGVTLFAASQLPIALPLQLPFMLFAFFTGFIQALVFTLMSTIYILLSMPEEEEPAPE